MEISIPATSTGDRQGGKVEGMIIQEWVNVEHSKLADRLLYDARNLEKTSRSKGQRLRSQDVACYECGPLLAFCRIMLNQMSIILFCYRREGSQVPFVIAACVEDIESRGKWLTYRSFN